MKRMECQAFLSRFSEFLDGRVEPSVAEEMEAHLAACPRCRRYSETLLAGRDLLKSLPSLDVPSDFRPRLDHRIFHVEDGESIARQSMGTGATTVSVLALAVLVALSAWAPAFQLMDPTVELPPVVAEEPSVPSFTPEGPTPTFRRNLPIFTTTEFQDGIWGDSHDLLREYSPTLERRRGQALLRVGIE